MIKYGNWGYTVQKEKAIIQNQLEPSDFNKEDLGNTHGHCKTIRHLQKQQPLGSYQKTFGMSSRQLQ